MKSLILIALLFLSASCAHHSKRSPASFSQQHYLSKYYEETARYILSHEPKNYGDFEELINDNEGLYKLIGQIDLNKIRLIPSRLTGKENLYRSIFDLSGIEQIPYKEWKDLKSEVVETYAKGNYVFRLGNYFYTLSGLKLNKKVISFRVYTIANNFVPNIDESELALSAFNRQTLHPLGDGTSLILPTANQIVPEHFNFLMRDFEKQVGPVIKPDPFDLVNYNYKSNQEYNFDGYKVYRGEKYRSFITDEPMIDSKQACDTRFYSRSLSRRKDAFKFMQTLLEHKPKLMEELNLSNNEYDELMLLSLGILAVESKMGSSLKYKIKEDIRIGELNLGQMAIKLIKKLKGRQDENSRGLTQIKDIGPLLEDTSYSYLEHSDLDNPENAALATMFVLKEKLGYLRHFRSRHNNITDDNWADYLYYFYQGASSQITRGLATPPLNLRIQKILDIKENSMIFTKCD